MEKIIKWIKSLFSKTDNSINKRTNQHGSKKTNNAKNSSHISDQSTNQTINIEKQENYYQVQSNEKSSLKVDENQKKQEAHQLDLDFEKLTDDQQIALYYCYIKRKTIIQQEDFSLWIQEEIDELDVDTVFQLLSSDNLGEIEISNDKKTFTLKSSVFKHLIDKNSDLSLIKNTFIERSSIIINKFKNMFEQNDFSDASKLFLLYINDKKQSSFGDRWMADAEIISIKDWESNNFLNNKLSENYLGCLNIFVKNEFVYASSFTSHGNPREYSLKVKIKEYLHQEDLDILDQLNETKKNNEVDFSDNLPF